MREIPILFSTEMVQAILDGRKSMTRRVVTFYKKTPQYYCLDKFYKTVDSLNGKPGLWAGFYKDSDVFEYEGEQHIDARYFKAAYKPGDLLYVQETWKIDSLLRDRPDYPVAIDFKAVQSGHSQAEVMCNFSPDRFEKFKKFYQKPGWQSPYFMPREAARIFLRVPNVRVERLQEITEEEAIAEGIRIGIGGEPYFSCRDAFVALWNSINAKRGYGWDTNPWVWVYEFRRVER